MRGPNLAAFRSFNSLLLKTFLVHLNVNDLTRFWRAFQVRMISSFILVVFSADQREELAIRTNGDNCD